MSSTATLHGDTLGHECSSEVREEARPRAEKLFRTVCLALTLTFPALLCLAIAYMADPDIWWHLSTGEWMLQHHAFPRVDTFSSTTSGNPWQAYSWLFELLLTKLYQSLGLAGVVTYSTAMVLCITAALFSLIYSSQKNLRLALPLTAVSAFALLTLFSPRPWHFTILFFILELTIVQRARRNGRDAILLLLPVIFAVWANLHIQFIDGLLLLALVLVESLLTSARPGKNPEHNRIPPAVAAALLAICICATLINPYGWHIYSVAHDLASQRGVVNGIEELKAMPFRAMSNYVVLFLTLGATATLARRRQFSIFEATLLVAAAALSFRSQRDIWLVVTVSVAILAQTSSTNRTSAQFSPAALFVAFTASALLLLGAGSLMRLSNATLEPRLEQSMPVQAAAFVRGHHLRGPVFCDFIWGGYLIHSLEMPVSIDGRAALHGDEQIERSARTWAGAPDWSSNSNLMSAGVVVGPVSAALTQLLRSDPRFDRVYEDKLAAVFIPHSRASSAVAPLH